MKNKKEKNQKFFQYNLFPKNYRGILAPEALKMIIAVICIGLLFYLGFSLYGITTQKTKVEQAKENLNQIFTEIASLEVGEKGDYLMTSPKEWYLVVYEEGEEMPMQCKGENCLCICPSDENLEGLKEYANVVNAPFYKEKEGITKCEKEGVCKEIGGEVKLREAYFYDRNDPKEKGTNIAFVNWISFYEIPKKLSFKKEAENLYISDIEIDSTIMSNFLNREIEFEGENKEISILVEDIFNGCSSEGVSDLYSWEPKSDKVLNDLIKAETESYLDELIDKGEIKGGKIIFSSFDSIWFSNLIFVSKGDEKSCSVLEEKEVCFTKIHEERNIGGYIRIYTCN